MELVPEKGAQTTEVANGGVGAQNEGLGNRDLTRWGSEGVPSLEPEEGVYEKLRECAVFSGELLVVQHWGFEARQVWGVKEVCLFEEWRSLYLKAQVRSRHWARLEWPIKGKSTSDSLRSGTDFGGLMGTPEVRRNLTLRSWVLASGHWGSNVLIWFGRRLYGNEMLFGMELRWLKTTPLLVVGLAKSHIFKYYRFPSCYDQRLFPRCNSSEQSLGKKALGRTVTFLTLTRKRSLRVLLWVTREASTWTKILFFNKNPASKKQV